MRLRPEPRNVSSLRVTIVAATASDWSAVLFGVGQIGAMRRVLLEAHSDLHRSPPQEATAIAHTFQRERQREVIWNDTRAD